MLLSKLCNFILRSAKLQGLLFDSIKRYRVYISLLTCHKYLKFRTFKQLSKLFNDILNVSNKSLNKEKKFVVRIISKLKKNLHYRVLQYMKGNAVMCSDK